MLRFCETKVAKEEFYGTKRKNNKNWDVDLDIIVFSKVIETKNKL